MGLRPSDPIRLPCLPACSSVTLKWYLSLVDCTSLTYRTGPLRPAHACETTISICAARLRTSTNTAQAIIHCWTPSRLGLPTNQLVLGPSSPSLCQVCTAAGKLVLFTHSLTRSLSPLCLYHGYPPFYSLIVLLLLVAFFPSSLLFPQPARHPIPPLCL